jgi:hypothetical protein
MRNKAVYWIERNKLDIPEKSVEYNIHIQSIDAFVKEDYEKAYKLAKRANRMNKSYDVLRLR